MKAYQEGKKGLFLFLMRTLQVVKKGEKITKKRGNGHLKSAHPVKVREDRESNLFQWNISFSPPLRSPLPSTS